MPIKIQYLLNSNPLLKKYLRENSYYYKRLIRQPDSINEMLDEMKKTYKINIPSKLEKLKDDISIINTLVDVIK